MGAATLALFLLRDPLFGFSPLKDFPRIVLWAWERPEDLRFLAGRKVGVAFLAATVRFSGGATQVVRRRQPLLVDRATPLMAVVRVETTRGARAALSAEQMDAVVTTALRAVELPRVSAVQIDSDAVASERAFFRKVLTDLRARLDPRTGLSFTALASWCAGDRWLEGVPVDEAVPMFFQMGPDAAAIRSRSAPERLAPVCRTSIGLSMEEGPVPPAGRRVYLFSGVPWTEVIFENAVERTAP
jgi:hypothetical protein